MLLGKLPVLQQVITVEFVPLQQRLQSPARETPLNDSSVDLHGDLLLPVLSVEVGRSMIIVQHVDHDSQESADFRHFRDLPLSGPVRSNAESVW
jgi:hypothetical protein